MKKNIKTSFMTSNAKPGNICVDLFGNLKVEKGLALFSGDFDKSFSVAKELKFDGIELSLADPGDLDLLKLRTLVDKHEIRIAAVTTGGIAVRDGLIFTSPEKSVRKDVVRIKKFIDFAAIFDAIVIIGLVKGWVIDNYEQSKNFITECLRECNDYSIKMIKKYFE